MSPQAQFVTDQSGAKTAVILPIAEYEELLEDLADLAVVAERAQEKTHSLDDVIQRLKQDGLV